MAKRFVIVGGGGYIGYHVGLELHHQGHNVTLLDLSEPLCEWMDPLLPSLPGDSEVKGMRFITGSVTCLKDLESAFESTDCVFLCASYGMSGREQMPSEWDKTEKINVGGTVNVIKACCSQGVSSLVYTSTFNVVFGGQEIQYGDESLPYFPLHRHVDHYSRTKSIAEQLVLMSDQKKHTPPDPSKSNEDPTSGHLRTCALRLAGVMGVKEKRHLPRIVGNLPYLKFRYGRAIVEFVSLLNVVQAHVKAGLEILERPEVLGGQAYFISDGKPVENFKYFQPLMERLGYQYPRTVAPMWIIWIFAYLCQFSHSCVTRLNPDWTFTPFLTPAEVYKTGVTHYFSIKKAKKDFGFLPENPNDLTEVGEYFSRKKVENHDKIEGTEPLGYLKILKYLAGLWLISYCVILFVRTYFFY